MRLLSQEIGAFSGLVKCEYVGMQPTGMSQVSVDESEWACRRMKGDEDHFVSKWNSLCPTTDTRCCCLPILDHALWSSRRGPHRPV